MREMEAQGGQKGVSGEMGPSGKNIGRNLV